MHLADIEGRSELIDNEYYRAYVKCIVHNESHLPLSGVRLLGSWFDLYGNPISGSTLCFTNNLGECDFKTEVVSLMLPSVRFLILPTGLFLDDYTYLYTNNHDPDGCLTARCDALAITAPNLNPSPRYK
jgi:hypothetical protein